MDIVKIQHIEQPTNQLKFSFFSAFKKFSILPPLESESFLQESTQENLNYVDQRITQNSFTLSSIDTDSSINSLVICKRQKHCPIQQTSLSTADQKQLIYSCAFQQTQTQTQSHKFTLSRLIAVSHSPSSGQKQNSCKKQLTQTEVTQLTIFPTILQPKTTRQPLLKPQDKQLNHSYQSQSKTSSIVFKKQSNTKSKKQQKKQKITDKKQLKPQNIETEDSHQKKTPAKTQNQLEQIYELALTGLSKTCKCCGKLIDKLCFKCPHLICNAKNCPRKRKKLLNEKMLERMKQQKIQQHYRQRQLYQKLKLQHGQNFNPQMILDIVKKQKNIESNHKNTCPKNLRHKLNTEDDSIEFEEDFTSEEEADSIEIYDQSQDQKKDGSKNKKTAKNYNQVKKTEVKHAKEAKKGSKKPVSNQKITKFLNTKNKIDGQKNEIKFQNESENEFMASLGLSDLETQPLEAIKLESRKKNEKKETRKVKKYDLFLDSDD